MACTSNNVNEINQIKIRTDLFPSSINYLTTVSSYGGEIQRKTFNVLLTAESDFTLKPLAAKNLPIISKEDSVILFDYTLRPETKWDDGTQMTSSDVDFSLKVFKLPMSTNRYSSAYYERLRELRSDPNNQKRFILVGHGNEHDLLRLTRDFGILQKSKFDPEGLLDHITLNEIVYKPEKIKSDNKALLFLDNFTSHEFKFNDQYFGSSGQYEISSVESDHYIRLVKNKKWWGHSISSEYEHFHSHLDIITYFSIPETLNAIYSLKKNDINLMDNIPTNEFVLLKSDDAFNKDFNLFTPPNFRFTHIGFNSRKEILSNKKFRHAISQLLNKEEIVNTVEKGYAEMTIGPINPELKYYYNDHIKPFQLNLDRAELLLSECGMIKRNGEWFNPNMESRLEISVIYRQNTELEAIAQIFKSSLEKNGIKINLTEYSSNTLNKKIDNRDFDIFIGTLSGSPFSFNFSTIFSTEAAKLGGYNDTGFGNAKSDSLILAINHAVDSTDRRDALFGLQEMLHDEATMIFLYFSQNKMAISKKFTNLKISSMKPGYDVTAFKLAEEIE